MSAVVISQAETPAAATDRLHLRLDSGELIGGDLVHLDAGFLELGDDVAVTLIQQLALQKARFGRRLADRVLVGRRELVPELLRGHQRHRRIDVVGERDVLLHFLHLVGVHVQERVFLTVDRLDLERREDLREGHRRGVRADGLPCVEGDRVRHHAQLEAGNIVQLGHGMAAVRQVAEAHAGPGEADEARRLDLLEDLLGGRTVEHGIHFLGVLEHEGQVPDLHFLHARGQRRQRADVEFLRAGLHGLKLLLVAAEQSAVIGLNLHIAVAIGADKLGELVHRRGLRMAVRHGMAELGLDFRRGGAGHQGDGSERRDGGA